MADQINNASISLTNSGFPPYLDFDALRTEGINYLGKLTGKIWTDYNVHDPGITTLEALCYALLDLGYRTNLPIADILARDPSVSTDDNFFTPAQILGCNPLTVPDYRKLLIDIDGVRNAWIEIADDYRDICSDTAVAGAVSINNPDCKTFINGLYHVYIDLEKNPDTDFTDTASRDAYLQNMMDVIKKALMEHRNLCEDFLDIFFLCKLEIGVCCDIEFEVGADPAAVYQDMINALREFFSPAPTFYSLPEMLAKNKTMDDIFAGRPIDLTSSHGFLDVDELQQLQLKKEIHLSDVYKVLFSVNGIKTVRKLGLRNCKTGTIYPGWKFKLPKNYVPDFSISCSGFRFFQNGQPLTLDTTSYDAMLELNFEYRGKIIQPAANLDAAIPQGVFHKDLGNYYSIQNDFPRVYGIGNGTLPGNSPNERKAQALQFKAYLLFFDQLLANYLAQLQHIRSLFALTPGTNNGNGHTYFEGDISSVPDLAKLLNLPTDATSLPPAAPLVFLFDKKVWNAFQQAGKLTTLNPASLQAYTFSLPGDRDIAVEQLTEDFTSQPPAPVFVQTDDGCFYYYFCPVNEDLVLVSQQLFQNMQDASQSAGTAAVMAASKLSYRKLNSTATDSFGFSIVNSTMSYYTFLQNMMEDEKLYNTRREAFLNHLLARFAEQFTDYALLSYGFLSQQEIISKETGYKQKYLANYPDLSSKRGKAYDYLEAGWGNDNISGLERRFKALCGIDNWKQHNLCNFEVFKYNDTFHIVFSFLGKKLLASPESFEEKAALESAKQSLLALGHRDSYRISYEQHENKYVLLADTGSNSLIDQHAFHSYESAKAQALLFYRMFTVTPKNDDIDVYISGYEYRPELVNDGSERTVRTAITAYNDHASAKTATAGLLKKINDPESWSLQEPAIGKLHALHHDKHADKYIDEDAFKIIIKNDLIGKPDKCLFEVLDQQNSFMFISMVEFDSEKEAKTAALHFIGLLLDMENYLPHYISDEDGYAIRILYNDNVYAQYETGHKGEQAAHALIRDIVAKVRSHTYKLNIAQNPNEWEFRFTLGFDVPDVYHFTSGGKYTTPEAATADGIAFHRLIPSLQLSHSVGNYILKGKSAGKEAPALALEKNAHIDSLSSKDISAGIDGLLEVRKTIYSLAEATGDKVFAAYIDKDAKSKRGNYAYRLLDKDHPYAYHPYSPKITDINVAATVRDALIQKAHIGYRYIEICLGGDMVVAITNPHTQDSQFYFQIKCRNRHYTQTPLAGQELILFESLTGYDSPDDAEQAFTAAYLSVLKKAFDPANYGNGKFISFEQHDYFFQPYVDLKQSVVLVPKETIVELGGYEAAVVKNLVSLCKSYPVRIINDVQAKSSCEDQSPVPDLYKFVLVNDTTGDTDWRSCFNFSSPQEAMENFNFFLLLLNYPGNFYIHYDDDHCTYRIGIREVLAESTELYLTADLAWEGVEKFICVSQTKGSFHTYIRPKDCCYSFYVACKNPALVHPCKYVNAKDRDKALEKLYHEAKQLALAPPIDWNPGNWMHILDGSGNILSVLTNDPVNHITEVDQLFNVIDALSCEDRFIRITDHDYYVADASGNVIAKPYNNAVPFHEWKKAMVRFGYYFPIEKEQAATINTTDIKYCVSIKMPGFPSMPPDYPKEKYCGCEEEAPCKEDCYCAWKNECCYLGFGEAWDKYVASMHALTDFVNYRPVFDCTCGSYRIEIIYPDNIIAANPQCYTYPEMDCDAVARAKSLINAEGLHLVEHILLRPRCGEDCRCDFYHKRCPDKTNCHFDWTIEGDPCRENEKICFVPGEDPYSFIATMVLPGWPERFRKQENRLLLETILQREAPAHVLLRILWLAPHDFCRFEKYDKQWIHWLAKKNTCGDFSNCDFLQFLFEKDFECLKECHVCEPCPDQPVPLSSCFGTTDQSAMKKQDRDWLNQVNYLFCFEEMTCGEKKQVPPAPEPPSTPTQPPPVMLLAEKPAKAAAPVKKEKPSSKTAAPISEKKKMQLVNSRFSKYRANAEAIASKHKKNELAGKTLAFLSDPDPKVSRLSALFRELSGSGKQKKSSKEIPGAGKMILKENAGWYFLDKICFEEKHGGDRQKSIGKMIEASGMNDKERNEFFQNWNSSEVEQIVPGIDLPAIRLAVEGN